MTVRDLINLLNGLPADLDVVIHDADTGWHLPLLWVGATGNGLELRADYHADEGDDPPDWQYCLTEEEHRDWMRSGVDFQEWRATL